MRQVARWAGKRRQNADNDPVSPRLAPSGRRHARIVMRVTRGYPPPPPTPPDQPVIVLAKPGKKGRKTHVYSCSHSCVPSASGQKKHPEAR